MNNKIAPIKINFSITEQKKRDIELCRAIVEAINVCGYYGEDAAMLEVETLKRIGRYDLLSTCE